MSYFDYFCSNIEKRDSDAITGICIDMCPEDEVKVREKETLVHVLEVVGPVRKLVKCYTRSSGDANLAVPCLLRPYSVLKNTVQYLLLDVTKRDDVPTPVVYDFVNDRLRAVRQDMTIQRLKPEQCINLLEPMVRFHLYYGYKLCELPLKDYDPVLNKKYLLECLKWLLTSCDSISTSLKTNNAAELSDDFTNLTMDHKSRLVSDRVLMESLYILCNLDSFHPLHRYLGLPKYLISAPLLHLAYKIAIANLVGNYIEVCKLMDKLCPLTYCAMCLYLPTLQRRALQVMSHAYSQRFSVPIEVLRRWLRFGSDGDTADACAHYGARVDGEAVRFAKSEWKTDALTLQPKRLDCDGKLNLATDYVFTYTIST